MSIPRALTTSAFDEPKSQNLRPYAKTLSLSETDKGLLSSSKCLRDFAFIEGIRSLIEIHNNCFNLRRNNRFHISTLSNFT